MNHDFSLTSRSIEPNQSDIIPLKLQGTSQMTWLCGWIVLSCAGGGQEPIVGVPGEGFRRNLGNDSRFALNILLPIQVLLKSEMTLELGQSQGLGGMGYEVIAEIEVSAEFCKRPPVYLTPTLPLSLLLPYRASMETALQERVVL